MSKSQFASLRAEIRHIVDQAGRNLQCDEIFARITRRGVRLDAFYVTINQMADALQLRKFKVKSKRRRYEYGPGPTPVDTEREYRLEREHRIKGFMQLRREEEMRKRGAE